MILPATQDVMAVLAAFGVGFIPLLELRFGIIVGLGMGAPPAAVIPAAVLGNILQIFLALPAIRWAYKYGQRFPRVSAWLDRTEAGSGRYREWIRQYGWLGLIVFIVLPLPGTGIWGGAVIARLLQFSTRTIWLGLSLGVAISGTLFGLGSWGVFSAVEKWFGL